MIEILLRGMLKAEEKLKIIEKHKIKDADTGSDDVQIALLSADIKKLLSHLKTHPKDLHSKRGLLKMVSQRRKLLKHLQKENIRRYNKIIKEIGLKK